MAATAGRLMLVKLDNTGGGSYQTVGGVRTRTISVNAEEVDITNSDSTNQFRELLAAAGVKSVEIALSGINLDDAYINQARAYALANTIRNWQCTASGWGTYQGLFQVSKFTEAGEYNGAMTYDMTLASAGEITFSAS